jgi:hypothetical protein
MERNLVIGSQKVNFRENGTTEKLVGVIVGMANGVVVGNGTGV